MIYRTSPEQIADYFANEAVSQSQLKLVAKGVDYYLANKDKLSLSDKYFDEPADHFIIGSAVDCKITEGLGVYAQKYKVSTLSSKPSETLISIMRYVFDKVVAQDIPANPDGTVTIDGTTVFPLNSYASYILEACERENYQPRYGADAKVNAVTKDTGDYWNEMIDSVGMQILTLEQSILINRIVDSFKPMLEPLINNPEVDIFFQFPLFANLRGKTIQNTSASYISCKGLVDMLIIDHKKEHIIIVDFKTMGDSVINFHSQMKKRRYDIQVSFYYNLLIRVIENDLFESIERYYSVQNVEKFGSLGGYSIQSPQFWVQSTVYDNNAVCYHAAYSILSMGKNGREAGYLPLSLVSGHLSTIYSEKIFGFDELLTLYIEFTKKSTKHPSDIDLEWDKAS